MPNGVKCNEKRNWVSVLRPMNCSGEVIRQLQAYVLNLLFPESLNTNVDLEIL